MGIGAAIAGGAALSAVGSLVGGSSQASAATSAANTQAAASDASVQATQQEQAQIRSDLMPFTQAAEQPGVNGDPSDLAQYDNFASSITPELDSMYDSVQAAQPVAMTQANLEQTPGYQFDLSQGLKSVQSSNAAKGLGVSGAALKDAATYATGLADNTYQNQFGIQQQQFNDAVTGANTGFTRANTEFNYLASPVQTSQASAGMTATTGLQSTANANNALMAGANATAAGTVGAANAFSGAVGGIGNSATSGTSNYMLAQALQNNGSVGAEQGSW